MLSSGGQQVRPHHTRTSPPSPTHAFTVFTRSIPTTPYVQARAELREKLHDKPGEKHTAYLPDNSPSTVRPRIPNWYVLLAIHPRATTTTTTSTNSTSSAHS
jgi:hypothetical protein